MGHQRPSNTDEVWWDFWEVCSIKLLISPVCELPWPASVISFSLVGGDMLRGKGNHHGLVWNQILLSQLLTSLLYDRMWKLTWISAWGQCLPLSREYGVSLFVQDFSLLTLSGVNVCGCTVTHTQNDDFPLLHHPGKQVSELLQVAFTFCWFLRVYLAWVLGECILHQGFCLIL